MVKNFLVLNFMFVLSLKNRKKWRPGAGQTFCPILKRIHTSFKPIITLGSSNNYLKAGQIDKQMKKNIFTKWYKSLSYSYISSLAIKGFTNSSILMKSIWNSLSNSIFLIFSCHYKYTLSFYFMFSERKQYTGKLKKKNED